ncbi:hypothetical protein HHX47_DHR3001182 [Lentinula edodes]|nr:hypothetical protein HHX47_DHR3001182 [Lentinula edodes]
MQSVHATFCTPLANNVSASVNKRTGSAYNRNHHSIHKWKQDSLFQTSNFTNGGVNFLSYGNYFALDRRCGDAQAGKFGAAAGVQDPEEQMPVSQVLTVDGIDPELLPTTKDSIAEGFKQAASEDHSMLKDPPAHITEFSYRVMSTIPRASSGILDLE